MPASVHIVLVRPRRGANVAAACRAMKNMGLRSLRLVGARRDMVASRDRRLAYGAWDVLDSAGYYEDFASATHDCAFVAGTSARPSAEAWTPRRLAAAIDARAGGGPAAIVFGPEASGLRADELRRCHAWVRIPGDPAQPSLNLAQAVLVVAYELRVGRRPDTEPEVLPRARSGDLEACLADGRRALLAIGYLNPSNPELILAELRRLLARAQATPREVSLLRGIARQTLWAAARVASAEPTDA